MKKSRYLKNLRFTSKKISKLKKSRIQNNFDHIDKNLDKYIVRMTEAFIKLYNIQY